MINYTVHSFCFNDPATGETGHCVEPRLDMQNFDIAYGWFAMSPDGYTVGGVWGGDQGTHLTAGDYLFSGIYVVENVHFDGVRQDNLELLYYSSCPITFSPVASPTLFPGGSISANVNCDLKSEYFGRGRAEGLGFNEVQPDGSYKVGGFVTWTFDNSHEQRVTTGIRTPGWPNLGNRFKQSVVAMADGRTHITPAMSGNEVFAFIAPLLYPNEAGTAFMRRFLSFSDSQILALRNEFTAFLGTEFAITVSIPSTVPLDNSFDMAGTTAIFPYELNHDINHRWILHLEDSTNSMRQSPLDCRIHEGGFVLRVGRMGLNTNKGYLQYGTLIQMGYYIFENFHGEGLHMTVKFQTQYPTYRNGLRMSHSLQRVFSTEYGWGFMRASIGEYKATMDNDVSAGQRTHFYWNN